MDRMLMYVHVYHTHLYNSILSSTAAFNNCYSELTTYTVLANSGLVSTMHTNVKATPINDNDYSCYVTAVELV